MQAIIWLVLGAVLILASSSEAACTGSSPTWSSTPDYASVSTCVSNASSGNTINVSAGSATWLSRLSVTKNVSIVGAGIGNTVIISGLGGTLITFVMPASTTTLTRLSGMTFILNNHHGIACYNVSQSPPVHLFRVDHMRFQDSTAAGSAIETFGCRGVIDTSEFDNLQYPLRIGWGDPGGGGFDWNNYPELVWGKPDDNMYVEDCVFTNISTAITDSDEGGRYALRYNSFGGTGVEHYPWLDIHGGRGILRGGMGGEVYGNSFSGYGYLMSHRGGRLAFFYNSATEGSVYHPYNNDGCPLETKEQINNSYIFQNRSVRTGTLVVDENGGSTCAGDVVKNQDYFMDNRANDGTNGVGAGPPSSRPVTCTTGVGYWATNQSTTSLAGLVGPNPATPISGTLYKCTATNTWTAYYTPLAYPHPLRSYSQTTTLNPPPGPPISPQLLRVK